MSNQKFPPNTGGAISQKEGAALTSAFKKHFPDFPTYGNSFGVDFMERLVKLCKEVGATNFYFENGYDVEEKAQKLVIRFTYADGRFYVADDFGKDGGDEDCFDVSTPCPPVCPGGGEWTRY